MNRKLFYVGVSSVGHPEAVDGYTIICSRCLWDRRANKDTSHHLGIKAKVFLDRTELSRDELDVCEDCDYPARDEDGEDEIEEAAEKHFHQMRVESGLKD
jgi:hypothetical protein